MPELARGPLGILGGTFDPIHYGHLRLAEEAREALNLEQVRLVPAGQPPHRGRPGAGAEARLAMAQLALDGHPEFQIDPAEVLADAPSYTVHTLERLRREQGERPLVLILGMDAFLGLPTWRRWRELFDLAHIGVATRPGYALEPQAIPPELAPEYHARRQAKADVLRQSPTGCILPFTMTPLAISATLIRERIAAGRSARYLLPEAVLAYIASHSLYL